MVMVHKNVTGYILLEVARALDLAFHTDDFASIKNQVIHIGSGVPVSVLDIAKLVLKYFNLPEDKYLKFIGDRPGQVQRHISSTQKAKDLLGWQNSVDFEDGLNDVIEWYVKNRHRWEKNEPLMLIPIHTNDNKIEIH